MTHQPEGTGGGGPAASGSPSIFRTYIVPPGASIDQLVEIAIEAHTDADGWAGQIRDDTNHMVIVYNATAAIISGIQFVFRQAPDHIGPITAPPDEPLGPPETYPTDPPAEEKPPATDPNQRTGRITAQGLNIRSEPVIRADTLLATLQFNDLVTILDDSDPYWYKIQWDAPGHDHAYVSKRYVVEV